MPLLFLAIETTGLIHDGMALDAEQQPRVTELAAELCDAEARSLRPPRLSCELVRSAGWRVQAAAQNVHKVSSLRLLKEGVPEDLAMWTVKAKADEASAVIAYQGDFTRRVVESILLRAKHGKRDEWLASWYRPGLQFLDLGTICTPMCRIKDATGSDYRRPKIEEAWRLLCDEGPLPPERIPQHAAEKLEMAKDIYRGLLAKNAIEVAA
jgi:hypothetical protein